MVGEGGLLRAIDICSEPLEAETESPRPEAA